MLRDAIEEKGIDCNVHLLFWTPQRIGSVLECYYWLPSDTVQYDRFYIRAGVVLSEERKRVEELLREFAVPELLERMERVKALPNDSTHLKSGVIFDATYEKGVLAIDGKALGLHE